MSWNDYQCMKCMRFPKKSILVLLRPQNKGGDKEFWTERGKCDGHCKIKCGIHFDDPRDDIVGEIRLATREEVQKVIGKFDKKDCRAVPASHDLDPKAFGINAPDGQTMIDEKKSLLDK